MEERGVGHTADVLFLAFMVSIASLLLIGAGSIRPHNHLEEYASNLARDILLTFQRATADGFGGISYEPVLPIGWLSERRLRHKTFVQLFIEDVLLNSRPISDGGTANLDLNRGFDEGLRELLVSTLNRFLGGRFGYRLVIQAGPFEVSPDVWVYLNTSVENFEEGAQQLCSEKMGIPFPILRFGAPIMGFSAEQSSDLFHMSSTPAPIILATLELWSR